MANKVNNIALYSNYNDTNENRHSFTKRPPVNYNYIAWLSLMEIIRDSVTCTIGTKVSSLDEGHEDCREPNHNRGRDRRRESSFSISGLLGGPKRPGGRNRGREDKRIVISLPSLTVTPTSHPSSNFWLASLTYND